MAENVEMIRPINLPEAQQLSENDVFILDSETGGVRKIPKNKVYTPVDDTLSESGEAADAKKVGDELADICVGADGTTYPTAGDAVRGQMADLKSDLNVACESLNTYKMSLEQGAVSTSIDKTYEQLKTSSTTRVRCDNLIPIDHTASYIIMVRPSDYMFSIVWYNKDRISVGYNSGGWLTGEYTLNAGAYYFTIAVRNSSNTDIVPTDVENIIVIKKNEIANLNEAVSDNTEDIDLLDDVVSKVGTVEAVKPDFISGVYQWDKVNSEMLWSANDKRATADLRYLELEQGDSIGITDYTTYSLAFGDNGSWYGGGYATSDITANNSNILPYIALVKRNDDAVMTSTDFAALEAQFHSSKEVRQVRATEEFAQSVGTQLDITKQANNNYLHFSFDDVGYCILNLVNNGASFDSLWDEPFFGMLKRLHDTYGAIYSLYIWDVANLANIPSKFKTELTDSSAWLKFGFHSYTEGSLADTSYNDAKTQYETFINYVFSKIGGVNSVDRMPRLNYFAGNVNALRALRDANCGCIGFLNTDDTRSAYYLTQEELTYLRTHSLWSDRTNGLQFVSTVMRLDWFVSGFSSQYDYNVPVEDNPYDELVYRYGQPAMADLYGGLIVFTHEWQTYSSGYALNSAMVSRIEQVCQFANDYGYDFDYPQNRIPNITSYVI